MTERKHDSAYWMEDTMRISEPYRIGKHVRRRVQYRGTGSRYVVDEETGRGRFVDETRVFVEFECRRLDELARGARFVVGHNVVGHDRRFIFINRHGAATELLRLPLIDTLHLAPLAFPQRPYHKPTASQGRFAGQAASGADGCT